MKKLIAIATLPLLLSACSQLQGVSNSLKAGFADDSNTKVSYLYPSSTQDCRIILQNKKQKYCLSNSITKEFTDNNEQFKAVLATGSSNEICEACKNNIVDIHLFKFVNNTWQLVNRQHFLTWEENENWNSGIVDEKFIILREFAHTGYNVEKKTIEMIYFVENKIKRTEFVSEYKSYSNMGDEDGWTVNIKVDKKSPKTLGFSPIVLVQEYINSKKKTKTHTMKFSGTKKQYVIPHKDFVFE